MQVEETIGDVDLTLCPRCKSEIDRQPYPGLHACSTFYKCGTHVIEIIGHKDWTLIDKIGENCLPIGSPIKD